MRVGLSGGGGCVGRYGGNDGLGMEVETGGGGEGERVWVGMGLGVMGMGTKVRDGAVRCDVFASVLSRTRTTLYLNEERHEVHV